MFVIDWNLGLGLRVKFRCSGDQGERYQMFSLEEWKNLTGRLHNQLFQNGSLYVKDVMFSSSLETGSFYYWGLRKVDGT